MPDLPYYPRYPKDIAADHKVLVMDNRAFGAYNRLLDIAWHEEPAASLPTDDRILAAYAKESLEGWLEIKPLILPCFTERNGRLWQKRMKAIHDEMTEKHRKRVESGSLGGRPKAKRKQCFSNASLRASDSESESVSLPFDSEAFREAWELWEQHRREIRKPLKPTATKRQLANLKELGEQRAIAAINHSIGQGWTGIFEPTVGSKKPASRNEGTYNGGMADAYDSLVRRV